MTGFSIRVKILEEFVILNKTLSQPDAILFAECFERLIPLCRSVVDLAHEHMESGRYDNREAFLQMEPLRIVLLLPVDVPSPTSTSARQNSPGLLV